ncbi:penicillin-binding protein activator [Vibrio mimicus]|uniref:Penicillin-binding protein activator LpoA n=1 Tax=Vibrio mimicus TaxID=674 RepID=A0A2J9V107_VIBMI|nr:penicillin-binding protein activator [Vibrio mimicus]EGU18832.1 lipoprotein, putative [Vibrio mimicus SX-4]KFE30410.1 lppC lipofamily protein [Vibrio mimicus]PNM57474.1 penicillin-binding protein activator [Vibrio mimicus]
MNHHQRRSVPRLLTPIALSIVLSACSTQPSSPDMVDITAQPLLTAQTYLMRADASQGSQQNDWLIMALKAAIEENNPDQAQLLIMRLAKQPLTPTQQAQWQLLRAQLLVNAEQYQEALDQLSFQANWSLPQVQWQQYHQLRADIFTALDRSFDSTRELIALYDMASSKEQEALADQIWASLNHYSASKIIKLSAEPDEVQLDGWLQLAIYMKTLGSDLPQLKNTLEKWLAENPQHPAAIYTPKAISDILALEIVKPTNTALLLPLTGKFAKQAQFIRDGFVFAMMNDADRQPEATLTIIDTNAETLESVDAILTNKQIDFVVGPLIKGNIEKLQQFQQSRGQTLPTLALNIPDQIDTAAGTCYLALSPEQEVAQAAKHLFSQGYRYPLILAPQNSYGERVVEAFNEEWRRFSKNKVAVNLFGDKRQLQRNINSIFGLQDSQQNIAQMESLVGMGLESQPRSRRDIDAVYIVANSSELTLIKPFIEVAINPDTRPPKLFSNSNSNTGGRQYEDLSGVTYSDIPLLVHPTPSIKQQMAQIWPESSNAERRLQALGMDAYQLMVELPQMKIVEGYTIDGQTGVLSIDDQCVVQREISWAEHSVR